MCKIKIVTNLLIVFYTEVYANILDQRRPSCERSDKWYHSLNEMLNKKHRLLFAVIACHRRKNSVLEYARKMDIQLALSKLEWSKASLTILCVIMEVSCKIFFSFLYNISVPSRQLQLSNLIASQTAP